MFGYLVAAPELMTETQLGRYRAAYCGLCRSLRARHGQISGLTLTYDMTFLVLFLSSLYEPEEITGEDTCAVHPFKAREWVRNAASDYAADMNLALAYQKCMDDWEDDGSVAALAEAGLMKRSYKKLEAQYPRQCAAIAEALNQLHEVEKSVPDGADEAAACFGAAHGGDICLARGSLGRRGARHGERFGQVHLRHGRVHGSGQGHAVFAL